MPTNKDIFNYCKFEMTQEIGEAYARIDQRYQGIKMSSALDYKIQDEKSRTGAAIRRKWQSILESMTAAEIANSK